MVRKEPSVITVSIRRFSWAFKLYRTMTTASHPLPNTPLPTLDRLDATIPAYLDVRKVATQWFTYLDVRKVVTQWLTTRRHSRPRKFVLAQPFGTHLGLY